MLPFYFFLGLQLVQFDRVLEGEKRFDARDTSLIRRLRQQYTVNQLSKSCA